MEMEWLEILTAAGSHGDLEQLKVLLENGADPNTVHPEAGNTPLYNACFANRLDSVILLLEHGADPNKRMTYVSFVDGRIEDGVVALMLAQTPEIAKALLAHGADPNLRTAAGVTPLMRQANAGRPEVVRTLLRAGADPMFRNHDGKSASDIAGERIRFMEKHVDSFKEGHAEKRIRQFREIMEWLGSDDHDQSRKRARADESE